VTFRYHPFRIDVAELLSPPSIFSALPFISFCCNNDRLVFSSPRSLSLSCLKAIEPAFPSFSPCFPRFVPSLGPSTCVRFCLLWCSDPGVGGEECAFFYSLFPPLSTLFPLPSPSRSLPSLVTNQFICLLKTFFPCCRPEF